MTECSRPRCTRAAKSLATGLCRRHFSLLYGDAHKAVPFPSARFDELLAIGYTATAICTAAGVGHDVVRRAYPDGNCYGHVRDAIVNVDLEKAPSQPAWRATRRVRSLAAAGMTIRDIGEASGLDCAYISRLAGGTLKRTSTDTFKAIDRVWNDHRDDPVREPAPRIARRQWATPWEWEDIDDPHTDVHGDSIVSSRSAIASIEKAIAQWGTKRTAEIIGISTSEMYRTLRRCTIRESTRARILGSIARETARIYITARRQVAA